MLKAIGLLSDGESLLKQPNDLLGSHVGETQKKTANLIARSRGKVLIIDEAYALYGNQFGAEALDTLVSNVHNAPGEDIAVVMVGYEKEMRKMFREANPGLSRRFSVDDPFIFEDYSDEQLERIAIRCARDNELVLSRTVRDALIRAISVQRFAPNFGNAGTVITMISRAKERLFSRDPTSKSLTLEDLGVAPDTTDPMTLFSSLFKTEHIERELRDLQAILRQCENDGSDSRAHLRNYAFLGAAGTGKTTVARIMAKLLHRLGLLGRDHVVIRSGLDLQGSYLGHTKDKVNEAMAEAQGGVLFIDEAYSLGGGYYSKEAVDQLVKLMTDPEHLHRTVVILAGYEREMQAMLSSANEGLSSRITGRMVFPAWDAQDCLQYIQRECAKELITIEDNNALLHALERLAQMPNWANARDCNGMMKALYLARARRNSSTRVYTSEDVQTAFEEMMRTRINQSARASQHSNTPMPSPPVMLGVSTQMHQLPPAPPNVQMITSTITPPARQQEVLTTPAETLQLASDDHGSNDNDQVFAALLVACKECGYDDSHDRRKTLITILEAVENGEDFTADIMANVMEKTNLSAEKVTKLLRPQVHRVLTGMRNAVQAEEDRLAALRELEEEERREREREHQRLQERLRCIGLCPMGYTWHRCGSGGWRCAGGSHFVSDNELQARYTFEI